MSGALSKIIQKVQSGEVSMSVEAINALPLPIKIRLVEAVETPELKQAWSVMSRPGNFTSGAPLFSLLAYAGVMAMEQKAGEAKAAFLTPGASSAAEVIQLKCSLLGCSPAELAAFEGYIAANPTLQQKLVGIYRDAAQVLRAIPPFSFMI